MTIHQARLHVGDDRELYAFDAFSEQGHLFSFTVYVEDLIKAIAGIEHKMDCEIVHIAGQALDTSGEKAYNENG